MLTSDICSARFEGRFLKTFAPLDVEVYFPLTAANVILVEKSMSGTTVNNLIGRAEKLVLDYFPETVLTPSPLRLSWGPP
jgi:hypothetical protein